jgi:hypothetical protein
MEKKIFLAISSIILAIERWWTGLGLSKKTDARLRVIGLFVGINALLFAFAFIGRWLGLKPGVDFRPAPTFRGSFLVSEILLLVIMFLVYRTKLKGD